MTPAGMSNIVGAGARHLRRLGDHRPHQPAGSIKPTSPAGFFLQENDVAVEIQLLRRAPRQPRGDDARHLRQRAHQEPDAARHRRGVTFISE